MNERNTREVNHEPLLSLRILSCISRVRRCRRAPRAQAACLLGYPPPSPGSSKELPSSDVFRPASSSCSTTTTTGPAAEVAAYGHSGVLAADEMLTKIE